MVLYQQHKTPDVVHFTVQCGKNSGIDKSGRHEIKDLNGNTESQSSDKLSYRVMEFSKVMRLTVQVGATILGYTLSDKTFIGLVRSDPLVFMRK